MWSVNYALGLIMPHRLNKCSCNGVPKLVSRDFFFKKGIWLNYNYIYLYAAYICVPKHLLPRIGRIFSFPHSYLALSSSELPHVKWGRDNINIRLLPLPTEGSKGHSDRIIHNVMTVMSKCKMKQHCLNIYSAFLFNVIIASNFDLPFNLCQIVPLSPTFFDHRI